MIEEQYVSFETAKLAKEKGFDEEINSFYVTVEGGCTYLCFTSFFGWMKDTYNNCELEELNSKCDERYLSAPTQSLLARWLREKHKLFIEVTVDFKNADYANNKEEFHSYEKVMEDGLQEALKLLS